MEITPLVQRQPIEEEEEELVQAKSLSEQTTPMIQLQPIEEEEEELQMQPLEEEMRMKGIPGGSPEVSSGIESRLNSPRGVSQPMSASTRAYFEPRFGADFSSVRVHTGSDAVHMNRDLNAQAFTLGRDIYFGAGKHNTETSSGKRLLAHELTHVVQQTHGFDASASIRKSRGGFYIAPLECRNRSNCSTSLERRDCRSSACGVGGSGTCSWGGPGARCCCYGSLTTERAASTCTPAAGIPSTSCSAYIRNSWWLPMAYVNNATCACRVTPNSPTANCVRKSLQDRLAATPGWLKVVAVGQKVNDNPANPTQYAAYQAFVQTFLTPRIYRDHVAAYSSCCCPSGPAAYPAWVGVTSVPMPCSAVGWSIRQFGSCHGTPGRW